MVSYIFGNKVTSRLSEHECDFEFQNFMSMNKESKKNKTPFAPSFNVNLYLEYKLILYFLVNNSEKKNTVYYFL